MKFLGYEITRQKRTLNHIGDGRGWVSLIGESFPGAWQHNVTVDQNLVISYFAIFACMTLISGDISKLRVKSLRKKNGVWVEEERFNPKTAVLSQPNPIQNRVQFWESWMLSKLMRGNTYVWKQRDERGIVNRMYVLDPNRVTTLISESSEVFYQLDTDNVSGIKSSSITVPGSEIIHDRMNTLFHPLVGLSPIYAAGLAATQGLAIMNNSTHFFSNRSIPGGILTSPHTIPDSTAERLKRDWNDGGGGANQGKTRVLGDGLEFKTMAVDAGSAQMLETLKATAEWVCSTFHVPPYKVGVGPLPSYNNVQALNTEYYSQCLQSLLEAAEECLNKGLELKNDMGVEFDIDGLLRMDTVSQSTAIQAAIGAGVMSPNEGRKKIDLPPVQGGESPYLQQQNFSLAALAKRDAKADPFGAVKPATDSAAGPKPKDKADDGEETTRRRLGAIQRGFYSAPVN